MIDAILGIDVSKNTLDVSISSCTKVRTKAPRASRIQLMDATISWIG